MTGLNDRLALRPEQVHDASVGFAAGANVDMAFSALAKEGATATIVAAGEDDPALAEFVHEGELAKLAGVVDPQRRAHLAIGAEDLDKAATVVRSRGNPLLAVRSHNFQGVAHNVLELRLSRLSSLLRWT